jgi:hypothetical protein
MIKQFLEKTSWLIIGAVILIFFGISIKYTQNIPYNDDYPTILDFIEQQSKTVSITDRIKAFFDSYGEHRVFFIRFVSFVQYKLWGQVNFTALTFIGNLSFMAFFIVLVKSVEQKLRTSIVVAGLALLLFQFQNWSNFTWAMTSLSNTLIFLWVTLSFYFFYKEQQKDFLLGIVFGILATYTNGNGIFTFAVAAVVFAFRKNYKYAGIVLALFAILFKLNNSANSSGMINKIGTQPIKDIIGKFFVFIGSNVFHPTYWFVAIGFAVVLLLYFVWLFFAKKYYLINPTLCSICLFIFLTALAVATQRENIDMFNAAPSRYRIYCSLLLACVFISLLQISKKELPAKLSIAFLPAAILFYIAGTFVGLNKVKARSKLVTLQSYLIEHGLTVDEPLNNSYNIALKTKVISKKNITAMQLSSNLLPNLSIIGKVSKPVFEIDTCFRDGNFIIIKGWAGKNDNSNSLNKVFATVHSSRSNYAFDTKYMDVIKFLNMRDSLKFANCGFFAAIPSAQKIDSITLSLNRGNFAAGAEIITTFATPQL